MKRLFWMIGLLVGVILCLVGLWLALRELAPKMQGDLSQPRIYAYRDWQSLGMQVNPGDLINIRAQGEWLYTPGEYHGPEGHRSYYAPDTYPINSVSGGVLLGRIGEDGYPFVVGRGGTYFADREGFLFLRINDDILSDNEGYVTVEVIVTSPEEP
jgi:hypothetical protein